MWKPSGLMGRAIPTSGAMGHGRRGLAGGSDGVSQFGATLLGSDLRANLPDAVWLCENSTRYNRTWNFGPYGHAESKKTQKFVFRSALRPIQISFSHDQDLEPTSAPMDLLLRTLTTDPHSVVRISLL
jgi:hypothetical protein